jgi:hypothetical protein
VDTRTRAHPSIPHLSASRNDGVRGSSPRVGSPDKPRQQAENARLVGVAQGAEEGLGQHRGNTYGHWARSSQATRRPPRGLSQPHAPEPRWTRSLTSRVQRRSRRRRGRVQQGLARRRLAGRRRRRVERRVGGGKPTPRRTSRARSASGSTGGRPRGTHRCSLRCCGRRTGSSTVSSCTTSAGGSSKACSRPRRCSGPSTSIRP